MAFLATKQSDTVTLPLDFYNLLKVNPGVSRESVTKAYERSLSEVPDVGYSSQLLQARTTILQGAHETLASPANRREYDERLRLGAVAEDVPLEFVAGTLMLLQEAGDAQTVVAVGEAWLSTHRRHRAARDVALATALAHCDLAGALLDARGSVEAACAMLDVAGKLLKEYKAGTPQLQADIEGAVAELRPQMALELLARTDSAESRSKGLELLPAALDSLEDKPEGGRRGDMTRKSFLDALRQVLSAEEQVQLFASAGAAFADTPAELYNAAVAHISAGCAAYDVKLIRRASELLAKAEAISQEAQDATATEAVKGFARDRRTIDERYRRSVAACVAALLLGDSGAAGDALGLRDGRLKCDRQVLAYIKANSPDPSSLLPGVCSLVQRWVSDVALTTFRPSTTAPEPFSLDDWFENPQVLRALETRTPAGANVLLAMLSAPLATLAKLFVLPSPAVNTAAQEEEVAEPEARVVVTPPAPAAHASPAPAPVAAAAAPHAFTPHAPAEAPIAAPAPSPVQPSFEDEISSQPSGRGMAQHRDDYDIEEDEDVEDDGEFLTHPVALEALQPLRGEDDWMRRAYEARQIRWGRLIGAVALVTGAAYLAVRAALPALAPAATPKAAIAPVPVAATTAGVAKPLSRGEASSLVTKWQRIKAAALGPQHAMDGLDGVLAGELLTQWQDRAVQLTSKGWHYTHDLQSCKVVEVVPGPVAGTALITAAMREGVTVHKGPDVDPQSFASEYQVVYHAVRGESGWVLTGAVIQAA